MAVNGASRIVVLLDYRTFQRQTGEYASRTRVGQHFRIEQYVGSGGSVTAYRTRRYRSFTGEFELGRKQMLQATIVHDEHDQVHAFDADLQSPTASANGDECGRAPAFRRAARSHSAAVFATNDEAAFDQVWHYHDALRTAQHFLGDALVGRRHDRLQDFDRLLHTLDRVFTVRAGKRVRSNHAHQADQQQ